jgi:hypothetical protein
MDAVDECERVLSVSATEDAGPDAVSLANKLYTQLMLMAREKDEEENGTYFQDIYMRNIPHRVNMIARHYQTLINNGDL